MAHDRMDHGDSGITTRIIHAFPDPLTERAWRCLLSSSAWASHYVAPEYFLDPKIKERRPFAILAEREGRIEGCLTGWHEGSRIQSGYPTQPQWIVLDPVNRDLIERAIGQALLHESKKNKANFIVVYGWAGSLSLADMGFWSRKCNSTYVIDLSLDEERLFRDLVKTKRGDIRRAVRHGLEHREAGPEDLTQFHEVMKATYRRRGIADLPVSVDGILKPETNRRLFVVFYRGQIIAGTIVRYHRGGLAEYSENASLPEYWQFHPNDLLLWESIKYAKGVGCRLFNMAGHNVLKKGYGGSLYPIWRVSLDKTFLRRWHTQERLDGAVRHIYRRAKGVLHRMRSREVTRLAVKDAHQG